MDKSGELKETTLYVQCGIAPGQNVAAFLTSQLNPSPMLSWVEPQPAPLSGTLGPWKGFRSIQSGSPSLDQPLDEARLFWSNRTLHVVENGNGCRWFAFSEGERVEWALLKDSKAKTVRAREYPIQLRKDWDRFGLETVEFKLKALEYWEGASLYAWRLLLVT
jgi:hypothetical protein